MLTPLRFNAGIVLGSMATVALAQAFAAAAAPPPWVCATPTPGNTRAGRSGRLALQEKELLP